MSAKLSVPTIGTQILEGRAQMDQKLNLTADFSEYINMHHPVPKPFRMDLASRRAFSGRIIALINDVQQFIHIFYLTKTALDLFIMLFDQILIDQKEASAVLEDEQRNTQEKIPLLGFMPKDKHAGKNAQASEGRSQKKQHSFRNPLGAIFSRMVLIQKHNPKRQQIHCQKKCKNYHCRIAWFHSFLIFVSNLISNSLL
jgi:hypothetical protein